MTDEKTMLARYIASLRDYRKPELKDGLCKLVVHLINTYGRGGEREEMLCYAIQNKDKELMDFWLSTYDISRIIYAQVEELELTDEQKQNRKNILEAYNA